VPASELHQGLREIGEMERDRGDTGVPPVDVASAADLVRRAVCVIDENGAADSELLLADLLCAAWPTPVAQSQ
jgi:hypothetical protein